MSGPWHRRKRPHTAHRHDVPTSVTITRTRHAFEGRVLAVIGTIRRRGVHYLLTVLPDGSRSLIPAGWTDWKVEPLGGTPPIDADDAVHDLGRLGDLLHLRKLVDALCIRGAESAPCRESRHAIEPGLFRSAGCSTKRASDVGANRRSRPHRGNRASGAPHLTLASERPIDGDQR